MTYRSPRDGRVRSRSRPADSRSWEPACGRADFRRVGVEARVSVVISGLNRGERGG
jgi:hypothetical protein